MATPSTAGKSAAAGQPPHIVQKRQRQEKAGKKIGANEAAISTNRNGPPQKFTLWVTAVA